MCVHLLSLVYNFDCWVRFGVKLCCVWSKVAVTAGDHQSKKMETMDYTAVSAGNKPKQMDDSLREVKIVATLGPASWTDEMIPKMIAAGTNIFRMNCSHRRGGQFEEVYPRIRAHAERMGKKVEVLGDLQGPKFRNGEIDPSITEG